MLTNNVVPLRKGKDVPLSTNYDRNDLIEAVARAFEEKGEAPFWALNLLECLSFQAVAAFPTKGSFLQIAVQALNDMGVRTSSDIGAVLIRLDMATIQEIHFLACGCNGEILTGHIIAERFRALKSA